MLFSSDWRILFVVLSILKFSSINCDDQVEVGTVSSVYATIGNRNNMEDYFIRIEGGSGYGIFGVFDGHGGDFAAKFAAGYFPEKIQNDFEQSASTSRFTSCILCPESRFEPILKNAIKKADKHLKTEFLENGESSGTTCLLVIAEERKLTVANVGDSRAVMCKIDGTAINLSIDHKPNSTNERQRIERAGGEVHDMDGNGLWRVNGLAMSRSLGDHEIKLDRNIIIAKPDITTYDLDEYRPLFMILASDGIWDVISSQAAVDFIRARYSRQDDFGAMALVIHAREALNGPHLPSEDNITVVIVKFNRDGHYEVGSASA